MRLVRSLSQCRSFDIVNGLFLPRAADSATESTEQDDMEVQVGEVATQADQFGLLHLFWIASPVVKLVMIGLIVASIVCWGIVIEKFVALRRMQRSIDKFEQLFWSGQSLEDLYLTLGPRTNMGMATLFMSAMPEWKRSQESAMRAGFQGVQMRINKVMDVQLQKEMSKLE